MSNQAVEAQVGAPEQLFVDALFHRVPKVYVIKALIALCVAGFLVQAAVAGALWDFPANQLIMLGGNLVSAFAEGQWWRLFSSMFLHGGLIHLALNMLALWQVGALVERLYGSTTTALIYLLAGLLGSLASVWWRQAGVSVGASGAVFGMVGALGAWLLIRRGELPLSLLRELRSGVVAFVGYSLFAGFVISGIDNAAHLGGLLAGALLGAGAALPLSANLARVWLRPTWWAALVLTVAMGAGLGLAAMQRGAAQHERDAQHLRFQDGLRQFALQEMHIAQRGQTIIESLRAGAISPAGAAEQLEKDVVAGWADVHRQLAAETADEADQERKATLLQYAEMRRESASLLARGLASNQRSLIDAADNQRLRAENLLLQWQLREARRGAASR